MLCLNCNKAISLEKINYRNIKYCSKECRKERARKQYVKVNKKNSSGTVGAINELKVAIDLFSKGYSVFRALSPNSIYDLIILKSNELTRVEVTTGHKFVNGKISYPQKDNSKFDLLAVVIDDGEIIYNPSANYKNIGNEKEIRKCNFCQKEFETRKNSRKIFCSFKCKYRHWDLMILNFNQKSSPNGHIL
ncbi:hypothetical protein KJ925_05770 [Patescibacteria group bacterium]|nr:hypothetical protein [Patescibacteria group bacterium]